MHWGSAGRVYGNADRENRLSRTSNSPADLRELARIVYPRQSPYRAARSAGVGRHPEPVLTNSRLMNPLCADV